MVGCRQRVLPLATSISLGVSIEQNRGPVVRVIPFRYNDCFSTIRFELPTVAKDGKPDKEFRPVSRDGDAWIIADPPGELPLYHGDELVDAETIWLIEGEGKTDQGRAIGLACTTSAHGSASAHRSDWRPLTGGPVCIGPDNDDSGRKYAREVTAILFKQNPSARIKIMHLPGLPPHGDIADFIKMRRAAGKTDVEIRAEIQSLADAAPLEAVQSLKARRIDSYKPFPVDVLPGVMARFVREGAEAVSVDHAMLALPILSAAGACIGNSRRVEIKYSWTEPPLVNTAVIGYSGDGKRPSRKHALAPIFAYQTKLDKEFRAAMDAHLAEHADWKAVPRDERGQSHSPRSRSTYF